MQATFFLGSCTPRGFSTFASELAEECGAVDYIKGGSGCGKSTFLRRIADEAAARGLEVWRFLCSSDPQSLDAVVLPSLGRGWVDATAPHVLEPTLCAGREGYVDFGAFYDRALSAKTDNRPDFQRMVKDSAKKLFDIVLVWKLDRFARNRYDSAHYKAILKKNGVKVVSAKEAIAEDSTGILLESLLEGYAEFYSVDLSEKIHRGQKENALKGLNNGGGVPLGYLLGKDKKLEIDPLTAPLVLEAFTRYADREVIREIVESFNDRGLHTKRNKPFNMNSFYAVLKNRKYIGEYRYQDVVIPGGVPAIVP